MKKVTEFGAYNVIRKSKGQFFSVVFRKKTTGEIRHINCRTGVKKYIKGNDKRKNYLPLDKGLFTVYDVKRTGYRTIPIDNILFIKDKKETYLVN